MANRQNQKRLEQPTPRWNFSKYLVNENGLLTHYFDASISPLSDEVMRAVNEKIK